MQTKVQRVEVQYGVHDHLARTVVGDVSPTIGFVDRNTFPRERFLRCNQMPALHGFPGHGDHGIVLDTKQCADRGTRRRTTGDDALKCADLQFVRRGVRHSPKIDQLWQRMRHTRC